MIRFTSDYIATCHPAILDALAAGNFDPQPGYGKDAHCAEAADLARALCRAPNAAVHFVGGGTQANMLACTAAMRPHQTVLAVETAHIFQHETGAIEAAGHKVTALPGTLGKISAEQVRRAVEDHNTSPDYDQIVKPKMVYISHPTEYGTLYTAAELRALRDVCREFNLILYADGARLGYGLCAKGTDVDLPLLAECCDAFTIGGAKLGAMFGEAIVITDKNSLLNEDFRLIMKQRGAMLSKGWVLGVQFKTMLAGGEEGLYFSGARHAIKLAGRLAEGFEKHGIPLLMPPATNQIFPVISHEKLDKLGEKYLFEEWEPVDEGHRAVRFCTSWSTREEDVEALLADLAGL
ncbi:low specificity L-threonine aldolase [Ruminococcaceae bacterium OttesenSCG-928-D13]|nr:low specificity L-threonine aldolase [Ruminococcaceae bacterium OttesenSCG-928-D13]